MILSDIAIRRQMMKKAIVIDPMPQDWQFQPASVDLTLGSHFQSPYSDLPCISMNLYTMLPGECMLATTAERIEVADDMVARVEGKSSWGRKFLMVHSTAGFIDPGFRGQITLELTNLSQVTQVLPVGGAIAQVSFHWLDQPAARPYGHPELNSHYQDQVGVAASVLPWA